jgi:hypothetical protein
MPEEFVRGAFDAPAPRVLSRRSVLEDKTWIEWPMDPDRRGQTDCDVPPGDLVPSGDQ